MGVRHRCSDITRLVCGVDLRGSFAMINMFINWIAPIVFSIPN